MSEIRVPAEKQNFEVSYDLLGKKSEIFANCFHLISCHLYHCFNTNKTLRWTSRMALALSGAVKSTQETVILNKFGHSRSRKRVNKICSVDGWNFSDEKHAGLINEYCTSTGLHNLNNMTYFATRNASLLEKIKAMMLNLRQKSDVGFRSFG